MNAPELAHALGAKKNGTGWRATCPAHDDHRPSLDINEGDGGLVLVVCRSGCSQEAVIDALKARGLWENGDRSSIPGAVKKLGTPKNSTWVPLLPVPDGTPLPDFRALLNTRSNNEAWDYLDSQGRLLGYVARINHADGSKAILPVTYGSENGAPAMWRLKGFPAPRPLFNLPGLADRRDAPVLVVEGEKTACAARDLAEEYVVVTWPNGSKSVQQADWRRLDGRDVTIWPDADPEGLKAAEDVARACGAASVRIVSLPDGLQKGWDLADEIPADMDVAALLSEAKDYRAVRLAGLPIKSAATIDATEYPPIRWAVPGLIPDGVTILAGSKSRGKSFIALDLAAAVAGGSAALGNIKCEPGPVLYLGLEDGERRIQARLRAILQGRTMPPALDIATEWRTLPDGLADIEAWITARRRARLVIVDVLAKVKGRPDTDRGVYDQDYALITPFHALARKHGVAIVLTHHTNKGSASDPVLRISGTMGLSGAADTTLVLSREARDNHGILDVRGRDVPERELALQFDADTGCVMQLGAADDFRKSEERRAIIRTLIDLGAATPAEIAQALGKKAVTVRSALMRMKRAGEVTALSNDRYIAHE